MTSGRSRALFAVLLVVWCAATWTLSSQSDPEAYVGVRVRLPDKVEHAIEYAVGGLLAAGAAGSGGRRRAWLAPIAFCAAWGVLDEIHQSYVPGRDATGWDVLADVFGAAVGTLGMSWWRARRQTPDRGVDESGELTQERRGT